MDWTKQLASARLPFEPTVQTPLRAARSRPAGGLHEILPRVGGAVGVPCHGERATIPLSQIWRVVGEDDGQETDAVSFGSMLIFWLLVDRRMGVGGEKKRALRALLQYS